MSDAGDDGGVAERDAEDCGRDAEECGRDVNEPIPVRVRHGDGETTIRVESGAMLRDALLAADTDSGSGPDLSPYAAATERLNCGGRGLCATCGVRVLDGPDASHWHDRLAERFGYPRLSCQVVVREPMTVELLTDKRVWGDRE